jgi:hypothetical protein
VKDQVPHPHITKGKIIIMYYYLWFLD